MSNWLDNVIEAADELKKSISRLGEASRKTDFTKGTSGPPPPPMIRTIKEGKIPLPPRAQTNNDVYIDYLTEKINIIINYTESLELKIEMLEKRITELES